jgi:RNA polymerase sigma factor (TIGR02999 family)
MSDITQVLLAIESDSSNASEQLLPLVYKELRNLAAAKLSREPNGQSIQATMLVHEVYLRLVDVEKKQEWNGRHHFFGAAAEAIRRILVERGRQRQTQKRAHKIEHNAVDEIAVDTPAAALDLLLLDEALTDFEREWPEKAKLVKLRYFAGFTTNQAAETLGISTRTAERIWTYAKAWLLEAMDDQK